ncbi:MAG: hypothetical protein AAF206_10985 [Bacteroidota bacterium]
MSQQDEFYIGYVKKAPVGIAKYLVWVVLILLILVATTAFILVRSQKAFSPSNFEFGRYTQLTGTLRMKPVPMLELDHGTDLMGDAQRQGVLLVSFGKFGARGDLGKMEAEHGELDGKQITLNGTLIYDEGKLLMELSEGKASLMEVKADGPPLIRVLEQDEVSMTGEIIDPKCYFGVMKPGEKKPHRSCAIRCISGGIPPVLKMKENGETDYIILVGPEGEMLNDQVLDKVAEPVRIKGKMAQVNDWWIMHLNSNDIVRIDG